MNPLIDKMISQNLNLARRATNLFFFISGIGISSWAPMIPYAKDRLHLNDALLGLVLLAFGIGALLMMPLTGWLVHRYGTRNIIAIGGVGIISLLPLLTIAPDAISLSVFLFFFGASLGASNVAVNSHAVTVEVKSGQQIMSSFHCLFSVGGLTGASFLSILLESGIPLFFCALIISSLLFAILFFQWKNLLPYSEDIRCENEKSGFSMPSGKVLFLGVLCFICFLTEGAMLDWSAVYLIYNQGYATAMAGIGYALFSVAMAFGRFIGDMLTQSMGSSRLLQLGSLITAAGLFLAVHPPWFYAELIGFIMVGIGASNLVPILFSNAGRLPNISPSSALSVVTSLGYLGILLGPALIGFIAEASTLPLALSGVAFLMLLITFSSTVVETEAAPSSLSS